MRVSTRSGPCRAVGRTTPGRAARIVAATALLLSLAGPSLGAPGAPEEHPPEEPQGQQEVVRTASGFTVRASNGSLPDILAEIGGEAGFDVLDSGKSYPPVTVAIEDTPLDSLLRQLLRGVNHIIHYKQGATRDAGADRGIDRIVLLTSGGAGGAGTAAPPARAGRVSPLAGTKTGKPAPGAPQAPPQGGMQAAPPQPAQPDDGTAALAAAAAAAGDAGGSEILRRLRAARAARGGGMDAGGDPNFDSMAAAAAATMAQHSGGQLDPSVLEAARLAAQRAIEANNGGGFGNQGGGFGNRGFGNQGFGNQGFMPDAGAMDDAQYPDE